MAETLGREGILNPSFPMTSGRNSLGGEKTTQAHPCYPGHAALLFQTSFVNQRNWSRSSLMVPQAIKAGLGKFMTIQH